MTQNPNDPDRARRAAESRERAANYRAEAEEIFARVKARREEREQAERERQARRGLRRLFGR